MTSTNNEKSDHLIKLTREELMSKHVDGLLQRQMNLRGEGVVVERKRRWYYQNWFIFMVVGCIAAIIAWAIIEPYYDDVFYIQGQLQEVQFFDMDSNNSKVDGYVPSWLIGRIRIRGEYIGIYNGTGTIVDGKKMERFSPGQLKSHREVGVYVDFPERSDPKENSYPIAIYIDYTAKPDPPEKASMTIAKLNSRKTTASILLFPLVAGFIGLAIGAADGLVCRVFKRALIGGGLGFIIGFIGGFFSTIIGGLLYSPLHNLAIKEFDGSSASFSTLGFLIQVVARTFAWAVVSMATGLGYGISLRSKRLVLYGFLGGMIGGILGGMFFDPIDLLLIGGSDIGAHWSRLIGLAFIGASVGMAIGVVELMARQAWLRMTEGTLAGKEFIVFKDVMRIGSSPRNEIYLFNDPQVKDLHARLLSIGDEYEIESQDTLKPVLINGRPVSSIRLLNGDRITIGKTSFIFEKRER